MLLIKIIFLSFSILFTNIITSSAEEAKLEFCKIVDNKRECCTYLGETKKDKAWGFGELRCPKSKYVGNFKNNYFHGEGELEILDDCDSDDCTYKGKWKKGKITKKVEKNVKKFCKYDFYKGQEIENYFLYKPKGYNEYFHAHKKLINNVNIYMLTDIGKRQKALYDVKNERGSGGDGGGDGGGHC